MASTVYITYALTDGAILSSRFGPKESPSLPLPGQGILDAGSLDTLPMAKTHRVSLGPTPALAARAQSDMDAEKNGAVREALRRDIASLDAARAQYVAHGWSTNALDARVAGLLAQHDLIP